MIRHLFIALLIVFAQSVSAHYIWIEASIKGKTGEKQEVKIFYGEYENAQREEAGKRLEEANGLVAWIIKPSGEKVNLELVKKENHFLSVFTPSTTGVYEILVMNDVREVVDWSSYDIGIVKPSYYSRFLFYAYENPDKITNNTLSLKPALELDVLPVYSDSLTADDFIMGQRVKLNVYFKKTELGKAKLMVYAPSGWMKEITRGSDGLFVFTPLEKGQYVIECAYKEKTTGKFKGKSYEAIRHRAVLTVSVK